MIDVLADSTQNQHALTLERRASIAHLWFETLHPFEDGNGRIGRAVLDLAFAQSATFHTKRTSRLWAVSPVILKRRKEYYSQLESTQKGNLDITEWLRWSTASIEQAYDEARSYIEHVIQVAQFWAGHRETPLTPRVISTMDHSSRDNSLAAIVRY